MDNWEVLLEMGVIGGSAILDRPVQWATYAAGAPVQFVGREAFR
jgi:hypothetical protein